MFYKRDLTLWFLIMINIITFYLLLVLFLKCNYCQNDCLLSKSKFYSNYRSYNLYRDKREDEESETTVKPGSRSKKSFIKPENPAFVKQRNSDSKNSKSTKIEEYKSKDNKTDTEFFTDKNDDKYDDTISPINNLNSSAKEAEFLKRFNIVKEGNRNMTLETYQALEDLTFSLRMNERLARLVFQSVVGWFSKNLPDNVFMTWNSTLMLWLMPDAEEKVIDNEDSVLQASNRPQSDSVLKFGNKTFTVCETLTEKEMYEKFVNKAKDEDVLVQAENPGQTEDKKGQLSKVTKIFTGLAKTPTVIVGSVTTKVAGNKIGELVKGALELPTNVVDKIIDEKKEQRQIEKHKKTIKKVKIVTENQTPASNIFEQPADEDNPFDG